MIIGVVKLGARISFESQGTSGGTGETISLIKMLLGGGAEVVAFSKLIKNETAQPLENLLILDAVDMKDEVNNLPLNALVVLNGNVNFFGGCEDEYQLANYHIINNFKGPVFYILCDPELTFKQIWPSVSKKEWGKKYKQSNIEVKRSDIFYVCQPFNTEKVKNALGKNEITNIRGFAHYPFEKFPFLNPPQDFNKEPSTHLSYGGTMRGGKRAKKMVKYYFGWPEDVTVEMFGKIALDDFKPKLLQGVVSPPIFTGPVQYDKMLHKMNQSMSHIVIGDPWYEEISDIPQRCYESILSNCVTFIDEDLDKCHRVYGNSDIGELLYVSSKEEVVLKLLEIINDDSLRKAIILEQFLSIGFNEKEYCDNFVKILE